LDVTDITKKAVTLAEKENATQAEAYAITAKTSSIYIDDNIPKIADTKSETGLGIKFIIGKQIGFTSSTLLSETLEDVIVRAKSIARLSREDDKFSSFPNPKKPSISSDKFYHRETAEVDSSVLLEKVMSLVKSTTTENVSVPNGVLRSSSIEFHVQNSLGVNADSKSTMVYGYFTAKSESSGEVGEGVQRCWSRDLFGIDFDAIGEKLRIQSLEVIKAKPFKEKWNDIVGVLAPSEAGEMLGSLVAAAVSGDNVNKGRSPWADRIGEEVAHKSLTMSDNGISDLGLLSAAVDDEGTPMQTTTIIENGVLKSFLFDQYNANQVDMESTGNGMRRNASDAQGRFTSVPTSKITTLEVQAAKKPFDEIISEIKRGVFIEHFAFPQINRMSGTFSNEIRNGILIENGELTDQIKYALWVGNLFESIKQEIYISENLELHSASQSVLDPCSIVLPTMGFAGTELVGQ
jgi:PmbA protein